MAQDPEVIEEKQIKSRARIGTLDGEPVELVKTHGGFCLVVGKRDGRKTTLGTGPHPGLAKFIAKKNAPNITMFELTKAENDTVLKNEYLLEKYEAITVVFDNALAKV